ncbi:hypothetical protein FISHEDRAFT_77225 [Fistulina hepatica ATCC 64428]|uniref:F-box domain-containing protein n=1 Tax=Fistulina hepatica ATCC 64428 TaxID=1128425 RepID=A0A0D7A274_9AGAR|nr:hypothetical protein FISHEDRAFT_77225 [Fistulina hepatica ATCC 64428]
MPRFMFEVEIEWTRHIDNASASAVNVSPTTMPTKTSLTPNRHQATGALSAPLREIYINPQSSLSLVIRVSELLLLVCGFLDMRSVCSLRATCHLLYDQLSLFSAERMMRLLKRVFQTQEDVYDFAKLLRATGAIMGGSTTLAVLSPTRQDWQPNDLDIIVHEEHRDMVIRFLKRCGFKHEKDKDRREPRDYAEIPRFVYRHYLSPREGAPGIDLSVVIEESPAHFILSYHSTIVMNFWNGHHLYCLWPRYTFSGRFLRNRVTTNPSTKTETAIQKYRDRGYRDVLGRRKYKKTVQDICYPDSADFSDDELELSWIPKPFWRQSLRLEPVADLTTSMSSLSL